MSLRFWFFIITTCVAYAARKAAICCAHNGANTGFHFLKARGTLSIQNSFIVSFYRYSGQHFLLNNYPPFHTGKNENSCHIPSMFKDETLDEIDETRQQRSTRLCSVSHWSLPPIIRCSRMRTFWLASTCWRRSFHRGLRRKKRERKRKFALLLLLKSTKGGSLDESGTLTMTTCSRGAGRPRAIPPR